MVQTNFALGVCKPKPSKRLRRKSFKPVRIPFMSAIVTLSILGMASSSLAFGNKPEAVVTGFKNHAQNFWDNTGKLFNPKDNKSYKSLSVVQLKKPSASNNGFSAHSNADLNSKVNATLKDGDKVYLLNKYKNGLAQINYFNYHNNRFEIGYVSTDYLNEIDNLTDFPRNKTFKVVKPFSANAEVRVNPSAAKTANTANIYEQPNSNFPLHKNLPNKTQVKRVGTYDGWAEVEYAIEQNTKGVTVGTAWVRADNICKSPCHSILPSRTLGMVPSKP